MKTLREKMVDEIQHYGYFSMDYQRKFYGAEKFPHSFVDWLNSLDEDRFLEIYNYTMYNFATMEE